jgi:hypothetical protein
MPKWYSAMFSRKGTQTVAEQFFAKEAENGLVFDEGTVSQKHLIK